MRLGQITRFKHPSNFYFTDRSKAALLCVACFVLLSVTVPFLAHLSQRLIGELIGYLWSGVRPSASFVIRPSFTMLKDLLRNRFANQSQISCGASLGRGGRYFVSGIWVT